MLTELQAINFKAWQNTGKIELAPITGLFGANGSGKSSLLQTLLLLKQSAHQPTLNLGNEHSLLDLGSFRDIIHNHDQNSLLTLGIGWQPNTSLSLPISTNEPLEVNQITLESVVNSTLEIKRGCYKLKTVDEQLPMVCLDQSDDLSQSYTQELSQIYYLGPFRDQPKRLYQNTGLQPHDIGKRGEQAINALIAYPALVEVVADWLKKLDLAQSFRLNQTANATYEVLVRHEATSPEVSITEAGLGVWQVLPIIIACHSLPKGSTLLIEHPELNLHPTSQFTLGDLFIEVAKTRNLQIIFESHSEQILQRLQSRMADETITSTKIALYHCQTKEYYSTITKLNLNEYGEITNWPQDFFGSVLTEMIKMSDNIQERIEKTQQKQQPVGV